MNVLEIGAGTGYNAALLGQLAGESGHVTTIDIDEDITAQARKNLQDAQASNVAVICADGGHGYAAHAPYNRIILTVGASDLTPAWRAQLTDSGRIVLPLALSARQYAIAFDKHGDRLRSHSIKLCGFMRLRGAFASAAALKVTDDYMLSGEQLAQLDTDHLLRLIRQTPQKHALPLGDAEKMGDLLDYVLLREPMLMLIPQDKTHFNFAYLLHTPTLDSIALLINQDARQWDQIAHVWTYGTDTAHQTLLRHIASFQANGQPSLMHSTILAYPSGHAPTPTPTQWLVRRKWMEYLIMST